MANRMKRGKTKMIRSDQGMPTFESDYDRLSRRNTVVIAEKIPRWSILARRHLTEWCIARTNSLFFTEGTILQTDCPIVLVHLDSFDMSAVISSLLRWNECATDPALFAACDDNTFKECKGVLFEAGVQEIFVGLEEFPRFGKRIDRPVPGRS